MRAETKKNRISITFILFRIVLSFILFFIMISGIGNMAIFLFSLAAFLSFFEIFIYKKNRSQLRPIFSSLADKLLVNLSAIALVLTGVIPTWAMLVFLVRDLLTIAGGTYLFYKDIRREFHPTTIGKITLFSQVIALMPAIIGQVDWVLMYAAAGLTAVSAVELLFKSEFRPVKRSDISDFFRITSLVKFSDVFTLLNAVFGLMAIFFVIKNSFNTAAVFLILAVIADFADGAVARKLNQQNVFGKELDSLADTISFGVAPAIFGFSLIQTPLAIAAFGIFLFCGILRLARYNIMQIKESFEGMPITLNGIIIPALFFFNVPADFYPYIYIALAILMVSNIRFRKI
ncbi:CDP-diacylglycerol--serine O-phosphatidyltransferase [Candidatus Woesearchaeota archaeon]|nr:CDP-diacylglycerol--serine O-phosphatidyltransferase [Candidatus Woesearchaeota archaeon]